MGFAYIGTAARDALAHPVNASQVAWADGRANTLRADYERWSRWGLGIVGYLAALVGAVFFVGLVAMQMQRRWDPVAMAIGVLGALVCVVGVRILWMLWRSGRRVLRAATGWMRLPYEQGRPRHIGGWVQARTINLEPPVFARIATGTLALLLALGGIALTVRGIVEGAVTDIALAAPIGVISLAAGLGQLGGVMRLVSGASEADPLWVRIREAFARD